MSTRARALAWILSSGTWLSCPVTAQDLPEAVLIERALRDGPRARAIRAGVEVTEREHAARLAWSNPSVLYSREGAGFTEFLQVEQVLPAFGVRSALARLGVTAAAAAAAERDARLWDLRADVRAAVAYLRAAEQRGSLAEMHVRDMHRVAGILRTREREGEGSRFDRVRAEQDVREAQAEATSAAIARADALALLSSLLPQDMQVTGLVDDAAPQVSVPSVVDLQARARQARAGLRALRLAADRSALEATAARKARGVTPTLTGGLKRADTEIGRDKGGVFGVALTLPLFDRGDREAARWAAEQARLEAERTALDAAVAQEVRRAAESLERRQAALDADDPSSAASLAEMAQVAYREGETGIVELLDALRTSARARMRRVDLDLDVRLAAIALERAVGERPWP